MMNKSSGIARWGAIVALPMLFVRMISAQSAGNWTQQVPSTSPSARHGHAMAYDAAHGQVVLFGGAIRSGSTTSLLSDTWIWDGFNWTQKAPQNSPSPRSGHAIAYDSIHGQVVLFGGSDGNKALSDTWVWDGSNWMQKSPQNSPSARVLFAMANDAAFRQVLLFGGYDFNKILSDTWVWDGSTWTQKSPLNSPSARFGPGMAYDSANFRPVLFGGVNSTVASSNGSFLGDTWTWDGFTWIQRPPLSSQNSPSVRESQAMAYDSAHSEVVLFGGADFNNPLGDTWTWDGFTWTQMSPQSSPSARYAHAMAYDSARGQTVMFGGTLPGVLAGITIIISDAGDTWTWNVGGGGGGATPAIGGVVSASAYGAFSSVAPGSWVEIYGTNLADHMRQWAGSDFNGNNAPTMLDGVQVVIGGQKAFVDFISSGQVNAQLPSNIGTGSMQITLTNGNVTSAPLDITVNTTRPGLLAPPSFKIGANQYVVAQFSDGTYVLPPGAIAGVTSRPAKPGETIIIYGVGFGPVIPNIPAGQIVTQSNQLSMPLQVLFGQTPAQTPYFGLAPSYVGLYQFNVVVPAVGNSDLVPLTFNLGGVAVPQMLFIAVRQ